ncbi:polyisoprenoid-binding protein [Komagataeibacter xylinus]|nr:polyisoprenoid-binding protein [Komagataeibacter xylinus]RFP06479.1 polyisoprenoid-binding protein [Komagataeibacter xylinus]
MIAVVSMGTQAEAADWQVDAAKSSLGFSGIQTGKTFQGHFSRYNATISLDPDHLKAAHVVVDVDLGSAETGDRQRDTALPGRDWFDVAQFPRATFSSTEILKTGENSYDAVGELNLRGVSKPVTLSFALNVEGATVHARGHTKLFRSTFGIGQGPWATGQWVALDVDVSFDIIANSVR